MWLAIPPEISDARHAAAQRSPDLGALASAAVRGDRAAARALLEALLPRVRNLVRYLVRSDADVDDIAQDALVAVLRGLGSYRADGPFEAWVDRITVRATFAARRRQRREREVFAHEGGAEVVELHGGAAPDEYLARRRAVQLLDELPLEQRRALVLHHVVGLSVPEIAHELEVSPDTIKSRIRLGIGRLRELSLVRRAPPTREGGAP